MSDEQAPPSAFPETWSVKEVVADLKSDIVTHLNKQDDMLTDISLKVDSKADKADLIPIVTKLDTHGHRITALEEHRQDIEANRRFHNRAWAVAGSVGGLLAIIAAALITAFVH